MKRRERTGSTARASRPPGLAAVLASPALAKLVLFFLSFEDAAPGTRELQRRTSLGSRSLQNELKRMLRFGWVRRERDGRAVRIVADWTHPAWRHLGGLAGTAAEPAEWREIMRGNEDLRASGAGDYDGVERVYSGGRVVATPTRRADPAILERLVEPEWLEWYRLTPQERWLESAKLWPTFFVLGGSLDPDADRLDPRSAALTRRRVPPDRRPGVRVVRRSGV